MSTATKSRPHVKSVRTMRLLDTSEGRLLRIENGNTLTYYRLTPLESHFGAAFRLQKTVTGSDCYDVLLNGRQSTCECKGFLRHGHCKHIESIAELVRRGKIALPTDQLQPTHEPMQFDDP